ncbi:uncharacterized protein LOC124290907 [Haliotis rubra]|uniref:uncharacterized protein LOC124254608 n=1 Tax=Haliotis rubra TaxID=36100 RepID=UPI001EE547BF|nr:uncharacterized protein LOC124254608 [Haliotis rubra]XP_046583703.1 uncharacterized protein LOC124290907 [Haliotis rubra]
MSDSDAGTSTGSTPYESEDDMICYITGSTQSPSEHLDLPDARRLNERSLHSRQTQTETTPLAGASVAAADGVLGPDTNNHLNKTSVSNSDVPSAVPADGSAESPYMRTPKRTVIKRLSVPSDDGIYPSSRRRLKKNKMGKKSKYQVSEAPASAAKNSKLVRTESLASADSGIGSMRNLRSFRKIWKSEGDE